MKPRRLESETIVSRLAMAGATASGSGLVSGRGTGGQLRWRPAGGGAAAGGVGGGGGAGGGGRPPRRSPCRRARGLPRADDLQVPVSAAPGLRVAAVVVTPEGALELDADHRPSGSELAVLRPGRGLPGRHPVARVPASEAAPDGGRPADDLFDLAPLDLHVHRLRAPERSEE